MATNRRSFIKYASLAAAGNAAGLRPFGLLNSLAQTTPDYKALVCIFLFGGNDANNTLIQFDTKGYQNYSTVRGPLAIPQAQLLQLGGSASNFALNPNLPDIQTLFNSKNAAIVANVGTLIEPTTRAQYLAGGHRADQPVFAYGPATGMAERGAVGHGAFRLGRPYCGYAEQDREPERTGSDDHVGRGRYVVL